MVMRPRRLAAWAALCGAAVLAGWFAVGPLGLGSPRIENTQAPIKAGPQPAAMAEVRAPVTEPAIAPVVLPEPRPRPQPETPSMQVVSAGTPDPAQGYAKAAVSPVANEAVSPVAKAAVSPVAKEAVSPAETPDECFVPEICIDRYLWSVYERAPKEDTIRVLHQIKVTIKKKGKTQTVTKTIVNLVDEDFTWKDPKA